VESYYTWILFDWCKPVPNQSRVSTLIRWTGVVSSISFYAFMMAFEFVQLVLEFLRSGSSIHSIVPNIIGLCPWLVAIATSIVFSVHREDFLSFFENWAQLELDLYFLKSPLIRNRYKKFFYLVSTTYIFLSMTLILGYFVIMYYQPEAFYLLSYYPTLRKALTLPGIMAFHMTMAILSCILMFLVDLVPAWFFYHAGLALESLTNEVEDLKENDIPYKNEFSSKNSIQSIRQRYERVDKLVHKANKLLGALILMDHATLFFMICTLSYSVLYKLKSANLTILVYSIGIFIFVFRLLMSIFMISKLHTACFRFRASLSVVIGSEVMKPYDSHRATLFLNQMNQSPLAARPLNLYDISPSTFVTLTCLTFRSIITLHFYFNLLKI